jgi:hypothetical protein
MGSTVSEDYLNVVVADIPPTPTTLVTRVSTTVDSIVVQIPLVTLNGGITLTSYEL